VRVLRWALRGLLALGLLALLAAAALFGGAGPLAFVPGGHLWGPLREPAQDWSFTDAIAEIQVQTHAGPLPWSVTTWVMSDQGKLFLGASECDRVWTHRVMDDPEIRLRIDGVVYEMQAHVTNDPALAERLAPVILSKYFGISADSARWIEGETTGCLFRVEPRS
jgi:hypothetical protein